MTTAPSKPSEVGWQFVSQYYTFVNKQPNRLHCFYTKNSAFVHGTEGEDGRPCYGQHEIHEKIVSIGFQDCKVYIHSVDAQASANNGIIIQAIGEMSNNNEPWRKFAQTFFLAEQPNGYFVLNDIFRYLKEDADEDEEQDEEIGAAGAAAAAVAGVIDEEAVPEPAPAIEDNYHADTQQQTHVEAPPALESQLVPVEAHPEITVPLTNGNGAHHEAPSSPEAPAEPVPLEAEEPEPAPAPVLAPSPPTTPPLERVPTPTPPVTPDPPALEEEPFEAPAPVPAFTPVLPHTVEPAPTPTPKPAAPEKPKTWANLAASKPNAWGSNLAADSKGVSAAAAPPAPASAVTAPRANGPHPRSTSTASPGPDAQGHPPAVALALATTTPQCFVKGVIETIDANNLRTVLTARFGPIKDLEIVRNKACAFLEFDKVESARKAIIASIPQHLGGEGGIRIGDGDPAVPNYSRDVPRILIETRKERGERPPSKPRGGAPPSGERGGYRGVGRGRGAPRGSAPTSAAK